MERLLAGRRSGRRTPSDRGPRLGASLLRRRDPWAAHLRLGPVRPWHREDRRHGTGYSPAVASPAHRGSPTASRHDRWQALGGGGVFQSASRTAAGWLPGSTLPRLAPPHDPGHGRPRLLDRPACPPAKCRESRNGSSSLIHYSLAESLINRLTDRRPDPADDILHWSTYRRRRLHQPASGTTNAAETAHELHTYQRKHPCRVRTLHPARLHRRKRSLCSPAFTAMA